MLVKCNLLIMLMLALATGCGRSSGEAQTAALPYGGMRTGDLAFRCGRGVFSRAVTSAEGSGIYSHVGLLVNDGGQWKVVHAVPREREFSGDFDRVKAESVEVFFGGDRAKSGCLVHTGLTDGGKIETMKVTALQWARDSIPFDDAYDLADSTRLYCTELVWRLYRDAGIDLSQERRRRIHLFSIDGDCLLPEHLYQYTANEIYYHF